MPKDYGLYLLLTSCLIVLSLTWTDYKGYSVNLSNWQGIECDWATNMPTSTYYQKKAVGSFRTRNAEAFYKAIVKKGWLRVGIDYYALMGVCSGMIPPNILQNRQRQLIEGQVFVYTITLQDSLYYWRP
jgi:hypothetical protein